ncbi:hypothetical protein F5B20DRAFT_538347 [Whalleya microplaca]|nr:hypothetical protein F5B20DRAFT_538347 [Whalleya microplaca]
MVSRCGLSGIFWAELLLFQAILDSILAPFLSGTAEPQLQEKVGSPRSSAQCREGSLGGSQQILINSEGSFYVRSIRSLCMGSSARGEKL